MSDERNQTVTTTYGYCCDRCQYRSDEFVTSEQAERACLTHFADLHPEQFPHMQRLALDGYFNGLDMPSTPGGRYIRPIWFPDNGEPEVAEVRPWNEADDESIEQGERLHALHAKWDIEDEARRKRWADGTQLPGEDDPEDLDQ